MKIIRQSNSVFPCQKWRSQKARVCGWKKIKRRGEGVRDISIKLKEDGQKKKTDARRKLMRGYWRRMGWRGKVGNGLTQFQGKNVTAQMSHRKKDKSTERCLSKLGNCPPWYLSHSNLISPNKLHYCSSSLSEESFLHRHFLLYPSLQSLSTELVRHLYQDKNVLQSIGCLPPLGPGSGGPRLMPPHEWPVQPLSLFTFVFLLFSHSSLCRTAEKKTEMLIVNQRWRTLNTLNIFTVTSILSLNHGVLQYVGSNYFDCRDKKKINVKCKCASSLWQHLVQLLFPAAPTHSCAQCSQQPQPSELEYSNQARGILHDLWGS